MSTTSPKSKALSERLRVSTTRKRRVILTGLALLSVWPVAHHSLVTSFDMDPWRFLGFSMYAVPKSMIKVRAVEMSWAPAVPAERRELETSVKRAFDLHLAKLQAGRLTLGHLYPWQSKFGEMLALLPEDVGKLSIVLTKSYLDVDATLRLKLLVMQCQRSDAGARIFCSSSTSRLEDWQSPA